MCSEYRRSVAAQAHRGTAVGLSDGVSDGHSDGEIVGIAVRGGLPRRSDPRRSTAAADGLPTTTQATQAVRGRWLLSWYS